MKKHFASAILFLFLFAGSTIAQQIKGIVSDSKTNEPIPGATVFLKGTTIGATTDVDGKFELTLLESNSNILVISVVGYQTQELKINKDGKPIAVKIKSAETELKTVEITGSRISEKQ